MTKQEQRRRICLLAVCGAALALPAIRAHAQARKKVRVGYNVVPIDAQMHLAREDKLFEKRGLDAAWTRFESGGALVQAIALGDIDVAAASEIPGIRPRLLGGKYQLVGQAATGPEFTGIYARSSITSAKDLVGKTVGITMGTISEWYLSLYADKFNVPYDQIKKINVAPPEWIPALANGDIDAFCGWEHFFSKADEILPKGTGRLLSLGGKDGVYLQPMFYYMSESMAASDTGAAIMQVLLDAQIAVNKDRKRAAEVSAKVANIDVPTSFKIVSALKYQLHFDDQSLASMRAAAGFLLRKKLIEREPDWNTFVNLKPLRSVDPGLVTLQGWPNLQGVR